MKRIYLLYMCIQIINIFKNEELKKKTKTKKCYKLCFKLHLKLKLLQKGNDSYFLNFL